MASFKMENENGDVDFDFFATPRSLDSPKKTSPEVVGKPPLAKHGDHAADSDKKKSPKRRSRSRSSSDSDSSDAESVRSVSSRDSGSERVVVTSKSSKDYNYSDDTFSESSSAYSDGSSSDEDREKVREKMADVVQKNKKSERKSSTTAYIDVREDSTPRVQAWDKEDAGRNRPKSSKQRTRNQSSSDKDGSDSEMTDVSPLPSPRESPSMQRKNVQSKQNGELDVQYNDTEISETGDIKLANNNLNLSVLMKAVSEIENERQQRLKANTRRVMFEPPKVVGSKDKSNYSFDTNRVSLIEKENQRLLREIMKHVGSKKRKKPIVLHHEPQTYQRMTPSAVNRQREQRRIEEENMHILRRLKSSKASKGMGRDEQLQEYQRTMLYGVPIAAVHYGDRTQAQTLGPRTNSLTSVNSAGSSSMRRRRPWSGKSDASSTMSNTGRSTIRLRPGSAKSITSITSSRPGSAKSKTINMKPPWDDRFCYS